MPDSAEMPMTHEIKGGAGSAKSHDSAVLHVSGEAVYTDDVREPEGCLHAYILQSPHAHARIKKIDTGACHIDGVHAVLTAQDIPGSNDAAPVFGGDPIFAEEEVHYAGQSVLAVIADTIPLARRAAKMAVIDYEELPAVLTTAEALEKQDFVGETHIMQQGDADKAYAAAPHKISATFKSGGQDHFYLEGQIAMAIPEEDGTFTCWSSTQHPSEVQHLIAKTLLLSDHAVTVRVRRMGGGFGGKESQASLIACVAALGAWKTGRPVKLRLDRDDDMTLTGKRHAFDVSYQAGFNDDGLIESLHMNHAVRCGMSPDLSNAIADRAMFHTDNGYFLKDVRITSYRCRTNTVSDTAFRGFGGPQGMLAAEEMIDNIARSLGKDPLDVRLLNLYDKKDHLQNRCTTPYGMIIEDNILHELLPALAESSGYRARRAAIDKFNADSKILKKGIALTPVKFGISFTLKMLNQAGALVHVYKDGSIQLNHGGTEMGQGLHTKVAQIVANEFQVDLDRVRITATDTGKVPNTSATAASSGTDLNGKAAQAAVITIKNRLIKFAAKHFDIPAEDVIFENNRIRLGGHESISFKNLIMLAYENRVSLSSTGFYKTPKLHWDPVKSKGRPFFYFAYGAAVTEVIIDTLTGEYNILRADLLHDVGRSINPAIDIGQIEGAYIQGNGWLTSEELWWDDKGVLKTHAPSTYKIPTGRDIPNDFRIELYKGDNPEETVYRSKAVGEPPFMLAISTFLAIKDAVCAARTDGSIPHLDAPATPEAVLNAINGKGRKLT
ncbi:MAG: xanthine dehydrogenase molybdopterin binding subunit [Pseudomonadota bacterium]|nr:xanthine dehydrogenase molybdopterin binding subunit [Pseudomonadota bacterium]QKK04622.1 MAG: xanthine dehydrogenase molybdopterin binding subunit [Pseudomonadota bacterium]